LAISAFAIRAIAFRQLYVGFLRVKCTPFRLFWCPLFRGKPNNRKGEATALSNLGILAARQGDCATSNVYFGESLRLCRDIGDRRGEANALNNLAAVAQFLGDFAEVRTYSEQSLQIKREMGDRAGETTTRINMGITCRSVGDFAGAKDHLEQALCIGRDIGNPLHECACLSALCLLHHQLGDDRAAQACAEEALRVAQEMGERSRQAEALCNLGHARMGLRQLPGAAEAYGQALALRLELEQTNYAMEAVAGLARVALACDDAVEALDYAEQILHHIETTGPAPDSECSFEGADEPLRIYLTCYRVLRTNDDARAEEVLEQAHHLLQDLAAKIGDEELRRSFLENVRAHREIVEAYSGLR
jgi:tetratricopeptide (TPR) repeat protein